jgi:hypothetical protein
MPTMMRLEALQPPQLKKTRWPAYAEEPVPAARIGEHFKAQLEKSGRHNPAKVLQIYKDYIDTEDHPNLDFLVDTLSSLGMIFDDDSFFSTVDRQSLVKVMWFEYLVYDIWERLDDLEPHHAPPLIHALANLEYRSPVLVPRLLDLIEENIGRWRFSVLACLIYNLARLGVGIPASAEALPRYSNVVAKLAKELPVAASAEAADQTSAGDFSAAAYGLVMANLYDIKAGEYLLPSLLHEACERLPTAEDLDASKSTQFHLYQALYAIDVEKPEVEMEAKQAIPFWIQKRLHERWLDSICVYGHAQGTERLQLDVDKALERTNTQSLLNCSVGREWDEQHCWFAGHRLEPTIAFEYNDMLPIGPGVPLPGGTLALKARLFQKSAFLSLKTFFFWKKRVLIR